MKNLLVFIWAIGMLIAGFHAIEGVVIALIFFVVGTVAGIIFFGLEDIENTNDEFNESW